MVARGSTLAPPLLLPSYARVCSPSACGAHRRAPEPEKGGPAGERGDFAVQHTGSTCGLHFKYLRGTSPPTGPVGAPGTRACACLSQRARYTCPVRSKGEVMLLLKPRFWPPSPTLPPRSTALRFAATVLVALAGVTVAVALPLLAEHRVVAWKGGKTLSPNFLWALTLALSQLLLPLPPWPMLHSVGRSVLARRCWPCPRPRTSTRTDRFSAKAASWVWTHAQPAPTAEDAQWSHLPSGRWWQDGRPPDLWGLAAWPGPDACATRYPFPGAYAEQPSLIEFARLGAHGGIRLHSHFLPLDALQLSVHSIRICSLCAPNGGRRLQPQTPVLHPTSPHLGVTFSGLDLTPVHLGIPLPAPALSSHRSSHLLATAPTVVTDCTRTSPILTHLH